MIGGHVALQEQLYVEHAQNNSIRQYGSSKFETGKNVFFL